MAAPETDLNSPNSADGLDQRSTPSRLDEGAPGFARNVGLAGSVFFAVGLLLWFWNLVAFPYPADASGGGSAPPARWGMITLWLVFGSLAMAYHAYRERTPNVRRLYGFLGLALVSFGALWLAFIFTADGVRALRAGESADAETVRAAVATGRWVAALVAGVLGLFIAGFALAPFVAACDEAQGAPPLTPLNFLPRLFANFRGDVQTLALGVVALQAVIVLVVALVFVQWKEVLRDQSRDLYSASPFNLLFFGLAPTGVWSLLIGLVFILLQQPAEDEPVWRLSNVGVLGWVGGLLALAALASGFSDLLKLPDLIMPYGLLLGGLGFVLLAGYLKNLPADGDLAYRSAWWLRTLGLLVALYALGRSLYPFIAETLLGREETTPYLVPNGVLLVFLGLLYAWLGNSYASEGRLAALVNRELTTYFSSPIAYVVIGGMAIIAWIAYFAWLTYLTQRQGGTVPEPLLRHYFYSFFAALGIIIAVPMLTMRLLSEEQRSGTMEVLLTAPIDETQIVLSKFFSSWIMMMVCWSTWLIFPIWLRAQTPESFDYRPLISFFFGMGVMMGAFLSLGLFCSSLTKNQIIAFLLALGGMLVMFIPVFLVPPGSGGAFQEIVSLTFYLDHLQTFVLGQNHWKLIVFYASFTVFWLFLTVKVLEARKWK